MVRLATPHLGTVVDVPDQLVERYKAAGYTEADEPADKPAPAPERAPAKAKRATRPPIEDA